MSNDDADKSLEGTNEGAGGGSSSSNEFTAQTKDNSADCGAEGPKDQVSEHGGPKGLEPTRYGDWEKAGRCIDF
ncbi:conserved hypothetical protein [gamma proteobacterium HTCC5015]|nr:conserved hypothetical protein [gamma proteobacterium HTCC5015]